MLKFPYKIDDYSNIPSAIITVVAGWDELWCPLDIKLDTGADMCILPLAFLQTVKAPYLGNIKVGDYRGGIQLMPMWNIKIKFNGFEMEAKASCTASKLALIGMNFISNFNVIFMKDCFLITDKEVIIKEVNDVSDKTDSILVGKQENDNT